MKDTFWNIKPNREKAVMLAKRQLAEFVCDAVNLEGLNFTLPEIQTILDGVTVGGHKLTDHQVAINQANTWKELFYRIEHNTFSVSVWTALELHAIAANEEALEGGQFRSGGVTIAGCVYMPPECTVLPEHFSRMVKELDGIEDIYDQAFFLFLTMARAQFFYDVNKRMGRFMMNGHLLTHGFPAINLPASRQLEFNELMMDFYESNNMQAMNSFLRSCLDKRLIKIMLE